MRDEIGEQIIIVYENCEGRFANVLTKYMGTVTSNIQIYCQQVKH